MLMCLNDADVLTLKMDLNGTSMRTILIEKGHDYSSSQGH